MTPRLLPAALLLLAAHAVGCGGSGAPDDDDDPIDTTPTLIYDGNGSTGGTPPEAVDYAEGDNVSAASPGDLVLAGSCFAFWSTKADRSGANYLVGQQITIGATDVTLYAQWNTTPTLYLGPTEAGASASRTSAVGDTFVAAISVADRDFAIDGSYTMDLNITLNNSGLPAAQLDTAFIQGLIDAQTGMTVTTLSATVLDVTGKLSAINAVATAARLVAPLATGTISLDVTVHDNGHVGGCELTDATTINVTYN
ncbi:MAG: hypothetical protein ACAI38_12320 [Myxococcota bacterium]